MSWLLHVIWEGNLHKTHEKKRRSRDAENSGVGAKLKKREIQMLRNSWTSCSVTVPCYSLSSSGSASSHQHFAILLQCVKFTLPNLPSMSCFQSSTFQAASLPTSLWLSVVIIQNIFSLCFLPPDTELCITMAHIYTVVCCLPIRGGVSKFPGWH